MISNKLEESLGIPTPHVNNPRNMSEYLADMKAWQRYKRTGEEEQYPCHHEKIAFMNRKFIIQRK
jgi:hypothetical protein